MPYVTLTDLLTRDSERDLINLTAPGGQAIDQAAVDQAIASAQAEVDSYIGGRVRLPLSDAEVSASIRHFALLIARYYLYADRKTQAVTDEYEQAARWLRDVAAGRAGTGVAQEPLSSDVVQGSRIVSPKRKLVFGAEFERAYDVPMGPNGSGEWLSGHSDGTRS